MFEDSAFEEQPKGTLRSALNMRPFCPKTGEKRLSRRGGMRGFGTTTIPSDGSSPSPGTGAGGRIQCIDHALVAATVTTSNTKGRTVKPVVVAGGTIKAAVFSPSGSGFTASYTAAGGTYGGLSSTVPAIFSAVLNGFVWFCDGSKIAKWDPTTNTAVQATASAGSFPSGPRLVCAWRGRLVFSGVVNEPQNWFMSAVDDPEDWDYAPVPQLETQAVAGNNAPTGQVPDIVNSLVPLSDDRLLFGGDRSLYVMRGDPAAGGRLDLLTDQTGMSWGEPWCKEPRGGIYFYGSRGGVFYLPPNGLPQRISNGVESRLLDVPLETTLVRMAYNDREQGVHVFFTDMTGEGGNEHLFFDERTRSWWPDSFADPNADVSAPHVLDGDTSNDRVLVLGGLDGVLRYYDGASDWDENDYILWHAEFGPLGLGEDVHCLLDEMECVFAKYADGPVCDADWNVRSGETAEDAFRVTPGATGTLTGYWDASTTRHSSRERLSGNRLYLRLSNDNREQSGSFCSIERLNVWLREAGAASYRLRRG